MKSNSRRRCGDPIDFIEFNKKIEVYSNKCAYCKINPFEHIDHFYPLNPRDGERVGTNAIENLFPSCAKCNHDKHNRDPYEWLAERFPMWVSVITTKAS